MGIPKHDGSGRGVGANAGRGCNNPGFQRRGLRRTEDDEENNEED